MKKIGIAGGVLLIVSIVAVYALQTYTRGNSVVENGAEKQSSPKNATYTIEGVPVTLVDGKAETAAVSGSASMITTEYFGNEVAYDFNADGRMDTAFILTQTSGGSGTFFYEVVALDLPDGFVGSAGMLIGDRITPQSSRIITSNGKEGVIEVNYADRKQGDSFATEPSVGKTLLLKLDTATMQFGEVVSDFEGEANPVQMSLVDKKWHWIRTDYTDGRVFAPKKEEVFTLTFTADGQVSATTDCNGMAGSYTVVANSLVFDPMAMTKMYCEGSEEGVFSESLGQVSTYQFTPKGELELGLKAGAGTMNFR
jgi:heat shock protein HslJ